MNVSIFFFLFCKTAIVFLIFAREIGAQPVWIDPLAHAQRLTAIFLRIRVKDFAGGDVA